MNYKKYLLITVLTLFTSLLLAEPVELTLQDGTIWQGETGEPISLIVKKGRKKTTVEGTLSRNSGQFIVVTSKSRDQVIFISDIDSISTKTNSSAQISEEVELNDVKSERKSTPKTTIKPKPKVGKLTKGVFLLPLDGGVGEIIRSTEIRQIAEHADEYGPGQIIVLDINSPGGSVLTGIQMRDLLFDIRKRHRVVAWVDAAISGGAFLSFCCDEIYFRRSSNLGSITMWSGNFQGAAEPEMNAWITQLEGVLAKTSRSPLFAAPMVIVDAQLSYDIDEETGEITYFSTTEGEHVLSDGTSVQILSVTAAQAEQCGLSDGIADTKEELAVLLDLDEWNEIDDYGPKLAKDWKLLSERAAEEIPELFAEFGGNVEARTNGERIMKQIKAGKSLLSWAKRLGETAMNHGLDDGFLGQPNRIDAIKRQIKDLEQQR